MMDQFNLELRLARIDEMLQHIINYQGAKLVVSRVETIDIEGNTKELPMTKMLGTPQGIIVTVRIP